MVRAPEIFAVIVLAAATTVACGPPCQDERCSIRPSEAARRRTAAASGPPAEAPPPVDEPAVTPAAPAAAAPAAGGPPRITEAVDVAQFEVLPPADDSVDIVRLVAPGIDAPCQIEREGSGYVARNATRKTMRIDQYRLRKGPSGELTAHPTVDQFKPGTGMPITFEAGGYRSIITCVDLAGWGDPAKLEYTDAGRRVNAMLEALGARFARAGIVEAFQTGP